MKIHGVTGEYVRQIHSLGLQPTSDDLVESENSRRITR